MTKLVVLGILQRKPLHGYEIKRMIEQEMGDWTNIAFGSIYFALQQLTKEGCVKPDGEEKTSARPAKIVYHITEKGRKEFVGLLTDIWKTHERQYFALDIGLYFSSFLKPADLAASIRDQKTIIEKSLQYIEKHRQEQNEHYPLPAEAESIFSHTVAHMKAEFAWLKELQALFEGKAKKK